MSVHSSVLSSTKSFAQNFSNIPSIVINAELLLLTFASWHILYRSTANKHPVLQNMFQMQ